MKTIIGDNSMIIEDGFDLEETMTNAFNKAKNLCSINVNVIAPNNITLFKVRDAIKKYDGFESISYSLSLSDILDNKYFVIVTEQN